MRFLTLLVAVGILVAVLGELLPLAWGFLSVTLFVFICYWSIYDIITPVPVPDEDD
jgi:hypothetical protein